ncbi:MAG TPA: HAD family hydrolase [Gemmatimonadaceae bacterium]
MNALPSAVFVDRDGTIMKDLHYVSHPEQVELIPGAAQAIARVNALLIPVIMVTNQSGIGRGYFTIADYDRVNSRLADELSTHGARIDASYYCPHPPDAACECRKPGDLLFRRAARDLGFDVHGALFIGDRRRDIEPGVALGALAALVPSENTPADEIEWARLHAFVDESLGAALDRNLCTN